MRKIESKKHKKKDYSGYLYILPFFFVVVVFGIYQSQYLVGSV